MYSIWTKHLQDPQEKERFERQVWASKSVLERVKQIMDEEKEDLIISQVSPKNYDSASWSSKQAHSNGFLQHNRIIHRLVDLDQQNIPKTKEN